MCPNFSNTWGVVMCQLINMRVCKTAVAACVGLVVLIVSAPAQAQYRLKPLVSNQVHQASTIDPLLANAWGLARGPAAPWWISDNDTGWSTLYDAAGKQVSLKVLIPTAGNGPASPTGLNGPGTPTGIVYNGSSTDFQIQGWPSVFIFATLDMYDGNFNLVKSFGDPYIPSNFSVFGIQDINGLVYVAYAIPNVGAGGFIDLFTEDGGIAFGGGNSTNGATNELFVTVGQGIGAAELAGTFASIVFDPTQDHDDEGGPK